MYLFDLTSQLSNNINGFGTFTLWIMIDKIRHLSLVTQATDKLKSEEEMAKEEKERLDKLEVIQFADDRIII